MYTSVGLPALRQAALVFVKSSSHFLRRLRPRTPIAFWLPTRRAPRRATCEGCGFATSRARFIPLISTTLAILASDNP